MRGNDEYSGGLGEKGSLLRLIDMSSVPSRTNLNGSTLIPNSGRRDASMDEYNSPRRALINSNA